MRIERVKVSHRWFAGGIEHEPQRPQTVKEAGQRWQINFAEPCAGTLLPRRLGRDAPVRSNCSRTASNPPGDDQGRGFPHSLKPVACGSPVKLPIHSAASARRCCPSTPSEADVTAAVSTARQPESCRASQTAATSSAVDQCPSSPTRIEGDRAGSRCHSQAIAAKAMAKRRASGGSNWLAEKLSKPSPVNRAVATLTAQFRPSGESRSAKDAARRRDARSDEQGA